MLAVDFHTLRELTRTTAASWERSSSYELKYCPGAVNQNADLLSRLPEGSSVWVLAVEQGLLKAWGRGTDSLRAPLFSGMWCVLLFVCMPFAGKDIASVLAHLGKLNCLFN